MEISLLKAPRIHRIYVQRCGSCQRPESYVLHVYDRMYGKFFAKSTGYTLYIRTKAWFLSTLYTYMISECLHTYIVPMGIFINACVDMRILPEGVDGANVLKCDFFDADHV